MASRILTFVSCTLYFSFLVIFTMIGLTSVIIGFVGLGLYIPTLINSNAYEKNTCFIIDHEYDTCHRQNDLSCYSIMWSVEYTASDSFIFSTITKIYETPKEALDILKDYKDKGNYTCYHHETQVTDVQWEEPSSPVPYLIMMIVGFSLTGIYLIVIGSIAIHRYRRK